MGTCEVCGNEYDKTFEVSMSGSTHTFDSFECAIHALRRPAIIKKGVGKEGVGELRDRIA